MDTLKAEHYALIIKKAEELIDLLEYEPDIDKIRNIKNEYKIQVDNFNNANYELCDPSNSEIQQYKINRTKWICNTFGRDNSIIELIKKMTLNLDSFKMYVLYKRKKNVWHGWHEPKHEKQARYKLQDELRDVIKNTIIKEFAEIHKKELSKIQIA